MCWGQSRGDLLYGKSQKQHSSCRSLRSVAERFLSVEFFWDRLFCWRCGWEHIWAQEDAAESLQCRSILEGLTGALRSPGAAPTTLWGAQMAPRVGEHWSCHCSRVQDPSDLWNWLCALGSVLKFQSCQGGRSVFQAPHRSVQLNIVFPSGLQPPGSGRGKGRAVAENGNILILWGNLSRLLWPRVGLGSV